MKNKAKRIALYNPYLETLGGGEKHILSILDVFAEQGCEINIFWDKNLSKEIANRFPLQSIKQLKWLPNIFKNSNTLQSLRTLQTFDYFFYVTDGSYFFSSAKNNFIFCMVPNKKLYSQSLINKLKLYNYRFISNSPYTTKWLTRWDFNPITIPPYIESQLFVDNKNKKGKIILSVGRFFSHLHSKKQDLIIKAFKNLKNRSKEFADYQLILAGGLMKEDKKYFEELKELAKNDSSIIFKPNLSLYELYKLYKLTNYFWHFTGYGVDEEKNPELVEHFGIAPLEAIASGCLTFCYSAGGTKELITEGENGFLFSSIDELINKMIQIKQNRNQQEKVINNGKLYIKNNFSYEVFREKVLKLI